MNRRRRTHVLLTSAMALVWSLGGAIPALAQGAASPPLEVAVEAVGDGGVAGLALLSGTVAGTTILRRVQPARSGRNRAHATRAKTP